MANYQVWNVATNEHVGNIEVGKKVEHSIGARVPVKLKGFITDPKNPHVKFDGVELRVAYFKDEKKRPYWALETNLPLFVLMKCEGFVPKLLTPTTRETYAIMQESNQVH